MLSVGRNDDKFSEPTTATDGNFWVVVYLNMPFNARETDLFYRASNDFGKTWSSQSRVQRDARSSDATPSVFVDANKGWLLLWIRKDRGPRKTNNQGDRVLAAKSNRMRGARPCAKSCTLHGTCKDGRCTCQPGWMGALCGGESYLHLITDAIGVGCDIEIKALTSGLWLTGESTPRNKWQYYTLRVTKDMPSIQVDIRPAITEKATSTCKAFVRFKTVPRVCVPLPFFIG